MEESKRLVKCIHHQRYITRVCVCVLNKKKREVIIALEVAEMIV